MNGNMLSKKPIIWIFIIGIFVIAGVVFAAFALEQADIINVFAGKPTQTLTIKAVPQSGDGETVTVFSTKQTSYQPLVLAKGEKYTLMIESDFDIPSTIAVFYDFENIAVAENQYITLDKNTISMRFATDGKSVLQIEITGLDNTVFFDGLTIENESEYTVYAAGADFLKEIVTITRRSNFDLILLNNLEIDNNLVIRVPCNLLLNGKQLNVGKDLIFDTELEGTFTIDNSASAILRVDRFFVEALKCDVVVKNEFFDYNGAFGYYINAKSYNGTALETDCRIIKNIDMLYDLLDETAYPRLNPNLKITFDSPISLQYQIQFSVPLTVIVNAPVTVKEPFLIKAYGSGKINIEINAPNSDNLFVIDAPDCDLTWSGLYAPTAAEAAERMNVKTFNGTDMRAFGLGGKGTGKAVSFKLLREKNKNAPEDFIWTVSGNVISLPISYSVDEALFKNAVLDIQVTEGTFSLNRECVNPDGTIDLTKRCTLTVTDEQGMTRTYLVRLERIRYNLPIVNIYIDGNGEVTSKEVYKTAQITIDCSGLQFPSLEATVVNIKGRGHSTWQWGKKPYKLKFDKPITRSTSMSIRSSTGLFTTN